MERRTSSFMFVRMENPLVSHCRNWGKLVGWRLKSLISAAAVATPTRTNCTIAAEYSSNFPVRERIVGSADEVKKGAPIKAWRYLVYSAYHHMFKSDGIRARSVVPFP